MQATGIDVQDMPMQPATFAYDFRDGRVYNLESSQIIRNGGGASGAHSDIIRFRFLVDEALCQSDSIWSIAYMSASF